MLGQILLGLLAGVAAGVVLLALGVRGKRINRHPVCRDCRFDLDGVYPGVITCPECGAGLKRAKAVRSGQRRRRPVAIAAGALLVAAPGLGLCALALGAMAGADLNTYKPVGLLMWEGRNAGETSAAAAVAELVDRMTAGKLTAAQKGSVADAALKVQADPRRTWRDGWGDLIERARLDGTLSDEQVQTFRNHAPVLTYEARARVRAGQPIPVVVSLREARIGPTTALMSSVVLAEATMNGAPMKRARPVSSQWPWSAGLIDSPHIGWLQMYGAGSQWGMRGANGSASALFDLPSEAAPGARSIAVVLAVDTRVQGMNLQINWGADPDWKSPSVRRHEAALAIEVLPADAPGVELVAPTEEMTRRVHAALNPTMSWVHDLNGTPQAQQQFSMTDLPLPVAYDVIWRQGEREWTVGSITSGKTADQAAQMYGMENTRHVFGPVNGLAKASVDIVLRPSPGAAERTTDVFRIYNGEIVYKGMDVQWHDGSGGVTITPSSGSILRSLMRALTGG